MAEAKESVYLVSTQYHFLLAAAIAAYIDRNGRKHLLISSHFRDTERLVKVLKGWGKNPFSSVEIVNELWGGKGPVARIGAIRTGLGRIGKFLDAHQGALDAYVFNIEQPEGQLLAYSNRRRGGRNVYVEDGIDAYMKRKFREHLAARVAKTLLYGHWYRRVETQIEYPYFDRIMVLRPELIDAPPAGASLVKIPNDVFLHLDRDGLIGSILAGYGVKNLECEALVLAPNSKQAVQMGYARTVDAYGRILDALARRRIKTVVKYHPREEKGDFLGVKGRIGMTTVNQSATSEMLFLHWTGRGGEKFAIGDTTTALCTCKLIAPGATAISIVEETGYAGKADIRKVFMRWGVLCPKTIGEAVALVSARGRGKVRQKGKGRD